MNRKFWYSILMLAVLLLTACGGKPETVVQTVQVTVEVEKTVMVEVTTTSEPTATQTTTPNVALTTIARQGDKIAELQTALAQSVTAVPGSTVTVSTLTSLPVEQATEGGEVAETPASTELFKYTATPAFRILILEDVPDYRQESVDVIANALMGKGIDAEITSTKVCPPAPAVYDIAIIDPSVDKDRVYGKRCVEALLLRNEMMRTVVYATAHRGNPDPSAVMDIAGVEGLQALFVGAKPNPTALVEAVLTLLKLK